MLGRHGDCLSISREPRWQGEGAAARRAAQPVVVPRASRATPQTPLSLPTLRDRADFPSCGVVASLLGIYPTASAPPCLRGNLPRPRPRQILSQAPGGEHRIIWRDCLPASRQPLALTTP